MQIKLPSPIKCLRYLKLTLYIWRWQYSRLARRFSFLLKAYTPFKKVKIKRDEAIYHLILDGHSKKRALMMRRYGSSEHNVMQNPTEQYFWRKQFFSTKGRKWEFEMPSVGRRLFNTYWIGPNQEKI